MNDEERTAAAFEGGWFHSGDLATMDEEGYIAVVDRKKDLIKTGGEDVASREVEEAIYLLPPDSEVAVVGLPHPRWIAALVAVVVLKAPKGVVFVDALPKNPTGKLLKRQHRQAYATLFAST